MRCGVRELRISAIIHQTEDEDLVLRLVTRLVKGSTVVRSNEGYYGGVVKLVETRVLGCDAERALVEIVRRMDQLSRQILLAGLESRIQDHNRLFFKLDKQGLATGSLELGEGDDVVLVEARLDRSIARNPGTYLAQLLGNG